MSNQDHDGDGGPAFVYETDIATTPERLWAALTSGELVHDQLNRPDDVDGWKQGWTPILTHLQQFLEGAPNA